MASAVEPTACPTFLITLAPALSPGLAVIATAARLTAACCWNACAACCNLRILLACCSNVAPVAAPAISAPIPSPIARPASSEGVTSWPMPILNGLYCRTVLSLMVQASFTSIGLPCTRSPMALPNLLIPFTGPVNKPALASGLASAFIS